MHGRQRCSLCPANKSHSDLELGQERDLKHTHGWARGALGCAASSCPWLLPQPGIQCEEREQVGQCCLWLGAGWAAVLTVRGFAAGLFPLSVPNPL